eukprot:TRINITY_DN21706_c0_g1_i2.p1 TRINITY_DN21706_c0_g1~~TRINITY_DN21706_c0_g1_i2.p1  ORF type:complete len:471 (-),score=103.61 TRINITY_DN21706_c0_g1_i2:154-1566(-)
MATKKASAVGASKSVRWADLARVPRGDPVISADFDIAEPASQVAWEGRLLVGADAAVASDEFPSRLEASAAADAALADRSATACNRGLPGRLPEKIDTGAGILAILDLPRSPRSEKWAKMENEVADFFLHTAADEIDGPAFRGTHAACTDWEEMEAELAEALHQASVAHSVVTPPTQSTAGLRATVEATAALATWPRSPRGFSRPAHASTAVSTASVWHAHEAGGAWLYKPAELIYFHLPSETLWRVDQASGAPVPPGQLAHASSSSWPYCPMQGLLRQCFDAWGGVVAALQDGLVAISSDFACVSEDALAHSAKEAMEALLHLSTGSAESCFRVVRELRRLRGALPDKSSAERHTAILRLRLEAVLDHGELERLSSALVDEARFQRLRGALSFGAALWAADGGTGFADCDGSGGSDSEALRVLGALEALSRALPGSRATCREDFVVTQYKTAGEIPAALRVALRQLGPI